MTNFAPCCTPWETECLAGGRAHALGRGRFASATSSWPDCYRPVVPFASAEVMRWVHDTELPLPPEDRQLLLEELEAHQRQQEALGAGAGGSPTTAGQGAADEDSCFLDGLHEALAPPRQRVAHGRRASQASAAVAEEAALRPPRRPPAGPEIVPAEEQAPDEEEAGDSSAADTVQQTLAAGLDWLGRCQHQAYRAAAAVVRPLLGLPEQQHSSVGGGGAVQAPDPVATLQMVGGGVLGAVLLYALYAERQALRRGASRARRAVSGSVADLLRMAFRLGVSPMPAAPGQWR